MGSSSQQLVHPLLHLSPNDGDQFVPPQSTLSALTGRAANLPFFRYLPSNYNLSILFYFSAILLFCFDFIFLGRLSHPCLLRLSVNIYLLANVIESHACAISASPSVPETVQSTWAKNASDACCHGLVW